MSTQHLPGRFLIAAMAIVAIAGQADAKREAITDRALPTQMVAMPAEPERATLQAPVLRKVSEREIGQVRDLAPTAMLLTCRRIGARMIC